MELPKTFRRVVKTGVVLFCAIFAALFTLAVISSFLSPQPEISDERKQLLELLEHAKRSIVVNDLIWRQSEAGAITATFTLHNLNPWEVYDLEIRCRTYGNSGTAINERTKVVRERLKPGQKLLVRNLSFGYADEQSKTLGISISDFESNFVRK
jgi:hypothetical protein